MAGSPNASLLLIPRELRLQIYDYVCAEEVHCRPITQWMDIFKLKSPNQPYWGFHSQPERNPDARLRLSWPSLLLTCKTIHSELDAYLDSLSSRSRNGTPDFVVDLQPVGVCGGSLGSITWKTIRRPQNKSGVLLANIDATRSVRVWGVGGPNPIVRGLYQALNFVVHCGPWMDARRPLSSPLHLRELIVNIECGETDAQQSRPQGPELLQIFHTQIRKIAVAGVVRGYIDKITVKSRDWAFEEIVDQTGPRGVPEAWDGYGFQWGLDKYQT